jgi:hypothetical protein
MVPGHSEHGSDYLTSVKCWEFVGYVSDYQLSWSYQLYKEHRVIVNYKRVLMWLGIVINY